MLRADSGKPGPRNWGLTLAQDSHKVCLDASFCQGSAQGPVTRALPQRQNPAPGSLPRGSEHPLAVAAQNAVVWTLGGRVRSVPCVNPVAQAEGGPVFGDVTWSLSQHALNHSTMAMRSYVWPSAVNTGSTITSPLTLPRSESGRPARHSASGQTDTPPHATPQRSQHPTPPQPTETDTVFGEHTGSVDKRPVGMGQATPRFWMPTTPPTNRWPEAPFGGGGGGSWRPRTRGAAPPSPPLVRRAACPVHSGNPPYA